MGIVHGLRFSVRLENQVEKKTEHEMKSGCIENFWRNKYLFHGPHRNDIGNRSDPYIKFGPSIISCSI